MTGLIGCEESQAVTKAFRTLSHEFFSNDLKPCSGGHPEWHFQADVIKTILSRPRWDFIGLHPVCTKMTNSGNRSYAPGKERHAERLEAVEWTVALWKLACERADRVYMENPLGALNRDPRLPRPQIIQPFYFGDNVRKSTCLWLHNLPKLVYAHQDNLFETKTSVAPLDIYYNSKRTKSGKSRYSVFGKLGRGYSEERSKTFPSVARAMAEQWGGRI